MRIPWDSRGRKGEEMGPVQHSAPHCWPADSGLGPWLGPLTGRRVPLSCWPVWSKGWATCKDAQLRANLLSRLAKSGDESVRSIAREQCLSNPESSLTSRRKEERIPRQNRLVKSHDGKGLEVASCTPISSSWVGDGSQLMRGRAYV
ncbi:hypothetical protein E2C01_054455 [Portunus trituberculatus]|uniref:Uncharacterized protein n=1 Tax=Portunus trituberculatus TaxID=210409 RepID=A0A5B7GNQ4_PORTR|nr:hypothetical protein [Portunus trituberculatus]